MLSFFKPTNNVLNIYCSKETKRLSLNHHSLCRRHRWVIIIRRLDMQIMWWAAKLHFCKLPNTNVSFNCECILKYVLFLHVLVISVYTRNSEYYLVWLQLSLLFLRSEIYDRVMRLGHWPAITYYTGLSYIYRQRIYTQQRRLLYFIQTVPSWIYTN